MESSTDQQLKDDSTKLASVKVTTSAVSSSSSTVPVLLYVWQLNFTGQY